MAQRTCRRSSATRITWMRPPTLRWTRTLQNPKVRTTSTSAVGPLILPTVIPAMPVMPTDFLVLADDLPNKIRSIPIVTSRRIFQAEPLQGWAQPAAVRTHRTAQDGPTFYWVCPHLAGAPVRLPAV